MVPPAAVTTKGFAKVTPAGLTLNKTPPLNVNNPVPKAELLFILTKPLVNVVPPEYVLFPIKIKVPAPISAIMDPPPLKLAFKNVWAELVTFRGPFKMPVPVKVKLLDPLIVEPAAPTVKPVLSVNDPFDCKKLPAFNIKPFGVPFIPNALLLPTIIVPFASVLPPVYPLFPDNNKLPPLRFALIEPGPLKTPPKVVKAELLTDKIPFKVPAPFKARFCEPAMIPPDALTVNALPKVTPTLVNNILLLLKINVLVPKAVLSSAAMAPPFRFVLPE
jgi:hypothetical protein